MIGSNFHKVLRNDKMARATYWDKLSCTLHQPHYHRLQYIHRGYYTLSLNNALC